MQNTTRSAGPSKADNVLPLHQPPPSADEPEPAQEKPKRGRVTQAELLVRQVREAAEDGPELFHTPDQVPYVTFTVGGHRETHRLPSKVFRLFLQRRFYEAYGKAPASQAIQDALGVMGGEALFNGPEHPLYVRLAAQDGAIYLDLGDPDWRQVEISDAGWLVLDRPRLRFRRPRGLAPLPCPEKGGSLDELRPFLNITDEDWPLVLGFLVAMVRPGRPYPVLNLLGAQGSAKSTTARVLRKLVDPNTVELRAEPRDLRDLAITATNGHVLALDNLSRVPPWVSDAICRIVTGGGFATRELYSDDSEALFDFIRPVLLTGIEELAVRGDLLDRSLLICLPTISDQDRQDEDQFWTEFEQARPRLLGALLDAVSTALDRLPEVKLDRLPRMADFAKWVVAAAPALGLDPDDWLATYERNRQQGHDLAVEASPVAAAVIRFMGGDDEETKRGPWSGTATELLEALNLGVSDQTRRAQAWPKSSSALSNALRRLQPNLVSIGLEVDLGGGPPAAGASGWNG